MPTPPDRSGRIIRRSDYLRVHRSGRKFVGRYLLLFYVKGECPGARVGITVSSRVGGAVVRNRAKRRIREAVREELGRVAIDGEVAFVALGRIRDASFDELRADMASLLGRALA